MGVDQATEIVSRLAGLEEAIRQLIDRVEALRTNPVLPKAPRASYTVEEVAEMVQRATYTVRDWCRLGQINATKRIERRGAGTLWNIAAEEVERYKNEGLLSINPDRNNRN